MTDVIPSKDKRPGPAQGIFRTGIAGIGLGAMAMIACELPIILALIGLGGLSAGAMAFKPPTVIELTGIAFAVIGSVLLIALALHRIWAKRRKAKS